MSNWPDDYFSLIPLHCARSGVVGRPIAAIVCRVGGLPLAGVSVGRGPFCLRSWAAIVNKATCKSKRPVYRAVKLRIYYRPAGAIDILEVLRYSSLHASVVVVSYCRLGRTPTPDILIN